MVMISTDKAVNPPNVMGAAKRVAELIVTGTANVAINLCSPFLEMFWVVDSCLERQIAEGGPVVTDFRMTRTSCDAFRRASRLVIHALVRAEKSLSSIWANQSRFMTWLRKWSLSGLTESEIPIVEVGIRPGEKLYEELLVSTGVV